MILGGFHFPVWPWAEGEFDSGSLIALGNNLNLPAMSLHCRASDGETDAMPLILITAVKALEGLEDAFEIFVFNSNAVITNPKNGRSLPPVANVNPNFGVFHATKLDRIPDQVEEDLIKHFPDLP